MRTAPGAPVARCVTRSAICAASDFGDEIRLHEMEHTQRREQLIRFFRDVMLSYDRIKNIVTSTIKKRAEARFLFAAKRED